MACIACHKLKKKCVPVEGQDRCKYCISKDIECHPHISQQGRHNALLGINVGKSLRQAAITFLLLAHSLSYTDVTGRSGHDSNTTVDTYQDKTNIATGMRAAKLLAHWDPDADVKVPKLDSLPDSAVYDMMKCLFIISAPMKAFMKGGDLHYVLRTCMASLIMHHNAVETDYGPENAVASKVLQAAVDANIKDQRYPILDPASLLRKWSQEVKDQFEAANPDIMSVTANGANMVATINQQSAMLQQLCAQNQALLDIVARKDQRVLSLEGTVLTLRGDVQTMNGNYQTMSRQLVEVITKLQSSRTPRSSRKRGREDDMSPQGQQRTLPAPPLAQPHKLHQRCRLLLLSKLRKCLVDSYSLLV